MLTDKGAKTRGSMILQRTVNTLENNDDIDRTAELLPILTQIMQKNPACADCNVRSMGITYCPGIHHLVSPFKFRIVQIARLPWIG